MSKRLLLCALAASLAVSCATSRGPSAAPAPSPVWAGEPLVQTRFGAVQGFADADTTWVWKAIPFARPPVGELRWRAPADPLPWTGVRSETRFHGACTQYSPVFARSIVGSEDCLYLNVWRPRSAEQRLPVYVWIHGGGNSTGSAAAIPDYYGNTLASKSNMVFVSIDYRLGPFGWFTHPALRDGSSAEDASGNFGTLDIIQGLKWIRENIASFGGDPGCVTVTGESAGGFDVLSLLIAAPAQGLFQRAMSESGAAITHGMDEADAQSQRTLEKLLARDRTAALAASMSPASIRDYLRSKSDREILRCYDVWGEGMITNPAILRDGAVIPREGFDVLSTGDYPGKVPLIVGSNKEELKLFLYFSGKFPWRSPLYAAAARYGSERWKAAGVDEVARRLSANADQPSVYAYLFSWGAPDAQGRSVLPGSWGQRLGAFHSLDVPFFMGTDTLDGVFHLFLFTRQNAPGRRALSDAMMSYVAQFARTGNPNTPGSGLPAWTPWSNDAAAPKCMLLDVAGSSPVLSMSTEELTDANVMARVRAELAAPLATATLDYLASSTWPASVR